MKRIFTSSDLILVTQLKDALESEGIPCVVRNEILSGLAPEVPFTESFPELWVANDQDFAAAERIKIDWRSAPPLTGEDWMCANCGERVEAQFSSCWKCGTPKERITALV